MSNNYRLLFGQPGVPALALFGVVGRLPLGMLGLAFVMAIVTVTGSYPVAGIAAAAYTLTSTVVVPLWSRAVDRVGPRTVLVITGIGQGLVLAAVTAATMLTTNGTILVALAGASGVFLPPLGAIMRALWSRLLTDSDAKSAAFAYESLVVDVVFILGPMLVAAVSALSAPGWALAASAVATTVGCLGVAGSPHVRAVAVSHTGARHWLGPLRNPAVLGVLPIGLLLIGSLAVIDVSLVSYADEVGGLSAAGLLIAVLSVGGVAGGLYWGSRRQPGTHPRQLLVLLGVLGVGWALLTTPGTVWMLAVLLLVTGLALNPAITSMFSTMDDLADEDSLTEAFGWLQALGSAGLAAGSAVAGFLVAGGADRGFLLAAAMCAAGCVIAATCQGLWQRRVLSRARMATTEGAR